MLSSARAGAAACTVAEVAEAAEAKKPSFSTATETSNKTQVAAIVVRAWTRAVAQNQASSSAKKAKKQTNKTTENRQPDREHLKASKAQPSRQFKRLQQMKPVFFFATHAWTTSEMQVIGRREPREKEEQGFEGDEEEGNSSEEEVNWVKKQKGGY